MARTVILCSGSGQTVAAPLDLGGYSFALGGPLAGGFRPQMYELVSGDEINCECKKKREKEREKEKKKKTCCWCGCSCKFESQEEDTSRLRYIPDFDMQLVTALPL